MLGEPLEPVSLSSVPQKKKWWLSPRRLRFNLIWPRHNGAGYDVHMDFFVKCAGFFHHTELKSKKWKHDIHLPSEGHQILGFKMEAFTIWLCLKMAYHSHKSVLVLMGIWEFGVGDTLFSDKPKFVMFKPHVWCWNRDVFVVFHQWQVSLIWIRKKTITSGRIIPYYITNQQGYHCHGSV